jgi:hypothetical protein
MSALELRNLVKETGALDRASDTRVTDVVSRGFAQRYLIEDGQPASWLKLLAQEGLSRPALRQLMFLYTARHNAVLYDFLPQVYWRKATSTAGEVTKDDTRDFLERAVLSGQIHPRWSDSMMERVTRYLLGTLEDFQMIAGNRHGRRQTTPPLIMEQTPGSFTHSRPGHQPLLNQTLSEGHPRIVQQPLQLGLRPMITMVIRRCLVWRHFSAS